MAVRITTTEFISPVSKSYEPKKLYRKKKKGKMKQTPNDAKPLKTQEQLLQLTRSSRG